MNDKQVSGRANKLLVVSLYLILQTLDVITTYLGLRRGAVEANLLPRWLLDNYGEAGMYAFKLLLVLTVLLAVVALNRRYPTLWVAIRIVNVMMLLVVGINLLAIV